MVRPFHYAVFLALLAAGLGGSVFLVPRQDELGLMFFKARQYPEARRLLEQRLAAGEHSIDVVVPLAEALVQSGEVERALALLRRFPVRPDERISLAERIGQFERYGQLTRDYLHTLEEISRTKRSEETLRELANLYRYFNQNGPLAATLRELIAHYAAKPGDFVELANLEAIQGQYLAASQTLDELRRRQPEAVNGDTAEFLISVLLDAGETARAEDRAKWWLARQGLPAEAVRLAGLMDARGRPKLGLRLLQPFEAAADTNPTLLAEWVHLQIATGASGIAFERLHKLRRTGRLPDGLGESFLELALARHDLDSAITMAEERGLERFPNWLLANLAEAAMAAKRDAFVHRMMAGLKEDFLAARPLLGARLALARGDNAGAVNWLRQAAADPQLRDADRLAIAGTYLHLSLRGEAFAQASRVRFENLSEAELLEAARIYLNLDRAQEGAARLDSFRARGTNAGAAAGWALLSAGAGRRHEVLAWLAALPTTALSEDVLKDLYYTAADHGMSDVAAECARRLYKNNGSDGNRLLLATALTAAGQPVEALPHLRALVARTRRTDSERNSIEEAYTAALRSAAQHSSPAVAADLRTELRTFWTVQLEGAGGDEKRRLDLIYGLLDIHAWDEALPALAELAHRRQELLPLYIESAVEAGRKQDVVSFLKIELDRSDLKPADRETRLYALIDHGGYDVALPFIRRLASSSSGHWIAAYEEALTKLGRSEELASFWRSQAALPGANPEDKRSLAFKLLDAGRKDWALPVFQDLARSAKPGQQDVADLLFLWGPKPGPEALAWLEHRARQSTGDERAAWWKHMLAAGAADRVAVMAADGLPEPGHGGSLLETYLQALAQLGDKQSFASALTREIGAVADPGRARDLARLARESGVTAAAETAYSRLLALAPEDPEALHWLGMSSFTHANYSAAEVYLQPLVRAVEGTYDDNFYYAELLWRKGDRRAARTYYGRVIRVIEWMPAPHLEAQAAQAQSLARCGFVEKAFTEFRTLVAAKPDNDDLRADFVALLLENARYSEALQVLSARAASNSSRLIELHAQLLAVSGQKQEAFQLLEQLALAQPDRARALAELASLDQGAGRQRQARTLLERATSLEPANEDFKQAIQDLDREQPPRAQTEATHRSIQGAQSEDLMRVIAEQKLGAFRVRFTVDQDLASVRSLRSPEGVVAPFQGLLGRGEASVQYESENGTRFEGTLYGSDAGPGVGAAVVRPDSRGANALRIELGRPYWEFAESLVYGGTRDQIELRKDAVFGPRLSARLVAALNRYGLHEVPNAASSVAGQGGVTFRVVNRPNISLEYNFDGEYKLSVATRTGTDGIEFHPLPFVSREVHSVSIDTAGHLTRTLEGNAAAGFAIDRFGGHAPFLSLNLKYSNRGRFTAGIDFDRRLYFLDTARSVTTIGGRLTFHF